MKERSAQSADAIIEEQPHIDETLRHIEILVSDIFIDVVRVRGKPSRHFNFGDAIVKTEIFCNV
jgi:hypothetical protein